MLYIIYERYILQTQKRLFKEPFLAFDYGPVVKEVYTKYKGKRELLLENDSQSIYKITDEAITPITYKIFREKDGEYISQLIKSVIDEYDNYIAWEMVEKTHETGTAWDKAYNSGRNELITLDLIKQSEPVK